MSHPEGFDERRNDEGSIELQSFEPVASQDLFLDERTEEIHALAEALATYEEPPHERLRVEGGDSDGSALVE